MIVIDASALVAILQNEPEAERFLNRIRTEDRVLASAVTLLEAGMVLRSRRGEDGLANFLTFVHDTSIEVVPFDAAQVVGALDAFARYGKGIHPQARLNLGDCASYSLAKGMNAPLLFKGDDFTHSDIAAAT